MRTALTVCFVLALAACDKNESSSGPPAPAASGATAAQPSASPGAAPKAATDVAWSTTNADALAAFKLGVDMLDNARLDEAREQFTKAKGLDPKFLAAAAMEGVSTPGPDGDKLIADALAQAGSLPEPERVSMQIAQAGHADDLPKAAEHAKKLTELVPGSWHAWFTYGRFLNATGKRDEAMVALKKAIDTDATAAVPYNDLAYVELAGGKTDDSIAHFRKYAEMRPKEPNPQDSLGEALLMAGKYDDAEAAYKKAIDLDAKFIGAWEGLAMVRLYKGDWAGAYDAYGKLRDAAPNVDEKGFAYSEIARAQLAQNKAADALKTLDAWDADATKAKAEHSAMWASLNRAGILIDAGKPADALKLLATIGDKLDKMPPGTALKTRWHALQHSSEVLADARLSKKDDADKALAGLVEAVGSSTDAQLQGLVAFGRGEVALAKGDAKGAAAAMQSCWDLDDYCVLERSKALDAAGDKAGAAAARDKLTKTHRRDAVSFYAWTKVAPAPTPMAKK